MRHTEPLETPLTVSRGAADAGRHLRHRAGAGRRRHENPRRSRAAHSAGTAPWHRRSLGSGETTLLHVIAGLLLLSAGTVRWGAETLNVRSEEARDRWRRQTAGLVFQDFALVPELSVSENILLPATFAHWRMPPTLRLEAAAL